MWFALLLDKSSVVECNTSTTNSILHKIAANHINPAKLNLFPFIQFQKKKDVMITRNYTAPTIIL
jgi:hypothetical protein